MQDREQMIINPYGDSFMVINKNQLINYFDEYDDQYNKRNKLDKYDEFYLCTYCLNKSFCDYEITFELNNSIVISNNIYFYNYYANQEDINRLNFFFRIK